MNKKKIEICNENTIHISSTITHTACFHEWIICLQEKTLVYFDNFDLLGKGSPANPEP